MTVFYVIAAIVGVLLMLYLIAALIRPEHF